MFHQLEGKNVKITSDSCKKKKFLLCSGRDPETLTDKALQGEPESGLRSLEYSVSKRKLMEELHTYKDSLSQDVLLVGNDLSTGFSDEVIDQILAICDQVNSPEDILAKADVWDDSQAKTLNL